MSKSLGNVIDPRMVIEGGKNQKLEPPYGANPPALRSKPETCTPHLENSGPKTKGADVLHYTLQPQTPNLKA
jgi:valyl-tRNA synthetase